MWPGPWPDFTITKMPPGGEQDRVDIDAMSIGLDWILVDPSGMVPGNLKLFRQLMTFSVTRDTVGDAGSAVAGAAAADDGASGDLFSFPFPTAAQQTTASVSSASAAAGVPGRAL